MKDNCSGVRNSSYIIAKKIQTPHSYDFFIGFAEVMGSGSVEA